MIKNKSTESKQRGWKSEDGASVREPPIGGEHERERRRKNIQ